MKFNDITSTFITEDEDDLMAILKKARDEDSAKFTKIRDSLSRKEIAFLSRMVKRKKEKKGMTTSIPQDIIDSFSVLGITDNKGILTNMAPRFLKWVNNNPSKEMDYIDKRADANDALTRGHLKRDNDWVPAIQKQGRKVVKSLTPQDEVIFKKLYNRFLNKKTKNLAKSWGDVPKAEVERLQSMKLIDDNGNLTDLGEYSVNYYMAFKDDPDGYDRVKGSDRVGNFGTARRRRMDRSDRITTPKT